MKITRRTNEQIDAGFPLELAKKGVDFKEWLKEQEEKETPPKRTIVIPPPPEHKQEEVKEEPKVQYVKHTETIILETKNKNKVEVEDLIKKALEKCRWEWKKVPLDSNFRIKDLDKYGKEGWKMAFVLEKEILPSLKSPLVCFQRPLEKEN